MAEECNDCVEASNPPAVSSWISDVLGAMQGGAWWLSFNPQIRTFIYHPEERCHADEMVYLLDLGKTSEEGLNMRSQYGVGCRTMFCQTHPFWDSTCSQHHDSL